MKMNKFYDTSSLLLVADNLFKDNERDNIIISSISLKELEHIKTSPNKDYHIKYLARQVLHTLNNNINNFTCIPYGTDMEKYINMFCLENSNDTRILATAYYCYHSILDEDNNFQFITNDLSLKMLASLFFNKDMIVSEKEKDDNYTGYLELTLNDEEMANFYSDSSAYGQKINIIINQYLNIYNSKHECVDTLCWTGQNFRPLKYKTFSSQQLGNIKPYKGDIYQAIAADSFLHNKITIIKGAAGTGKSHLALGYLFSLLEHNKIDKIIIFCNTIATKNSAKLGLRLDKALV